MTIVKKFNDILKGRIGFEEQHDSWARPEYRDALGYLLAFPEFQNLAAQTGAATVLSLAWTAYQEETISPLHEEIWKGYDDESNLLLGKLWHVVDELFSTKQGASLDQGAITSRFTTFALEATNAFNDLESDLSEGMILSIDLPAPVPGIDNKYPEIYLLDEQCQALLSLIRAMGRQTGPKSWSEWFAEKFVTVKNSIPALIEMGTWKGLSTVINKLLNIGLIGYSIAGFQGNIITFGSNILTPWQSLIEFPKLMTKQAVLYHLIDYGKDKLKLSDDSKVIKEIKVIIDSIDWAAVRMAFKVTPLGLFISAYSLSKFVVVKAKPDVNLYYDNAKNLIDIADTMTTANENKLAMLAILHLAGSPEKFVELMTCRQEDAYSTLVKLIDF